MPRESCCWLSALFLLIASFAGAAEEGKVTLPISAWERMLLEIEAYKKADQPTIPICPIERKLDGVFRKGLLRATLATRFEVLDNQGHVRVPILDAGASLGEVLLNGQRTSLLQEGNMYTLGVDRPGVYDVRLQFFWGKEQDRFARRLSFKFPSAGVTQVSLFIPEKEIQATLAHGALTSERAATQGAAQGTRLDGHLDASGLFDLSWSRKLTHRATEAVRMDARLNTLFTIHEAMVSGLSVFDLNVLEGETDRVDLRLPPEIEVVRVEGDPVLQWRTEANGGGRLTVLLRYLVENEFRIAVYFQFQAEVGKPIALRMPLPPEDTTLAGAVGIQGPAGLNVQVASLEAAKSLTLRDLPPELTDLTSNPLLFGFSFSAEPRINLTVTRNQEMALTSTVIDELLASTVLIEDGTEVTKLKVRIRNNASQYLTMRLPEKAILTHSLIDGRPVRPATTGEGASEVLLFPLRQSERIGGGMTRLHTVRPDETLSGISNFYYSNPSQWQLILEGNRDRLQGPDDLYAGQKLRIPLPQDVKVEESSFVIELAYKLARKPLGAIGRVTAKLPEIDVDTQKVTWHFYFPEALLPLSFDANLTQYDFIRYDLFRRLRDFYGPAIKRTLWKLLTGVANAGSDRYVNVLRMRKEIYRAEADERGPGEVVLSSFPLVGERYRFSRSLLGRETPTISVTYVPKSWGGPIGWVALLATFVLTWILLRPRREVRTWLGAGAALLLLLVLAHYFLGVHRKILCGIDLALLVAILRLRAGPWWKGFKDVLQSPWRVTELLTLSNLAVVIGSFVVLWFVLSIPMLLTTTALFVLFFWWRRKARLARKEVAHG